MQRLPPLKSIEAFVAVAETLSFTRAASSLHITKSAISRRIQSLEADLEVRLFRRTNSGIELTIEGKSYFERTGPAFEALRSAGQAVGIPQARNRLHIALPQSFASSWLIPRLPGFYERHPKIELQLDSLRYFSSLEDDRIDVSLKMWRTPDPSFHFERLMDVVQIPVCNPTILERRPIKTIDDLGRHTLLHLNSLPTAWSDWLTSVGRPDILAAHTRDFDTMSLLMDAAVNGLGIAMGIEMLCRDGIDSGRLVTPLPYRFDAQWGMYFVCRKPAIETRLVRKFRSWLIDEAAKAIP